MRCYRERLAPICHSHRKSSSGMPSLQATVVEVLSCHHLSMLPHRRLLYTAIAKLSHCDAPDCKARVPSEFLRSEAGEVPAQLSAGPGLGTIRRSSSGRCLANSIAGTGANAFARARLAPVGPRFMSSSISAPPAHGSEISGPRHGLLRHVQGFVSNGLEQLGIDRAGDAGKDAPDLVVSATAPGIGRIAGKVPIPY